MANNNKPEVAAWYDALTCELFFNPDVFPMDSLEEIPLYLEPPEDNSNNKTRFNPTIEFHGPAAIHNMVCPILHHTQEPAVFNCNGGYFKPSLKAQKKWDIIQYMLTIG